MHLKMTCLTTVATTSNSLQLLFALCLSPVRFALSRVTDELSMRMEIVSIGVVTALENF